MKISKFITLHSASLLVYFSSHSCIQNSTYLFWDVAALTITDKKQFTTNIVGRNENKIRIQRNTQLLHMQHWLFPTMMFYYKVIGCGCMTVGIVFTVAVNLHCIYIHIHTRTHHKIYVRRDSTLNSPCIKRNQYWK